MNAMRLRPPFLSVLIGSVLCTGHASAGYPERMLRAIVPFSAGGPNDIVARVVSPPLSRALGQQIIVENRPGANARIGIEALARSAPDGYTILFSAGAVALIPALRRHVPYDPIRDMLPVAELGNAPYGIAIHPLVPARSLADLIQVARQNPGKLNSASAGSSSFLAQALFQLQTGTRITNLPYKGGSDAALAVVRGEADLAIMDFSSLGPHVTTGRLRLLAVTSERRAPTQPAVPTTREAGLDFTAGGTFSVFTVGGTPADIVRRLNAEITRIVEMPVIAGRFAALGITTSTRTVDEMRRWHLAELAKWKGVVNRAKIPLED